MGTRVKNSQASEPNSTMRDAMWRGNGGWEIAATPVLLGLGGWFLDGVLDIRPALTILGVIIGLIGAVANQYYRYRDHMAVATAERRSLRPTPEGPTFGRRPEVEFDADDLSVTEVTSA